MNRLVKVLLGTVLCAAMLMPAGCASSGAGGKSPDPAAVTAGIQKQVKYADMNEISAERLQKFYIIGNDKLEKSSVLISSMSSADELAVFKVKNSSDTASVKSAIQSRIKQKTADFQNYNAAEYDKVKKYVVETRGNYVFFTICGNPEKAKGVFDGFFK